MDVRAILTDILEEKSQILTVNGKPGLDNIGAISYIFSECLGFMSASTITNDLINLQSFVLNAFEHPPNLILFAPVLPPPINKFLWQKQLLLEKWLIENQLQSHGKEATHITEPRVISKLGYSWNVPDNNPPTSPMTHT